MPNQILVPSLGESVTEATVSRWLKQVGEQVESDEPLVELETDKVNIEVPSPISGTLSTITVKEGDTVKRLGRIASINVGEGVVGRVVNTLGQPIDGKGPIQGETFEMPLERQAPGVIFRDPVTEPMQTGIKSIGNGWIATFQKRSESHRLKV